MTAPEHKSSPPAFALPAALLAEGFRLRPESEADIPFLVALYASTRQSELTHVSWSEAQKSAFLISQFAAQRFHYRTYFADTAFDVIERHAVPVGRLYVDVRTTHVHIIDVALMPEARGRGTGTTLFTALQDYARGMAMGLDLFVEKYNPARRLYHRLGFAEIAEHEIQVEMEWLPDSGERSQQKTA